MRHCNHDEQPSLDQLKGFGPNFWLYRLRVLRVNGRWHAGYTLERAPEGELRAACLDAYGFACATNLWQ